MQTAFWLVQSNQVTPTIYDFLKLFQIRMNELIDISFIIPDTSPDIPNKIKELNPTLFKVANRTATKSHQGYLAKQEILSNQEFSSGLTFTDTLLLDDLGGGGGMLYRRLLNWKSQTA